MRHFLFHIAFLATLGSTHGQQYTITTIAGTGTAGSTGNGSYTSGGTVAGSGSGTCEFYLTPQGYANADCSSSAGLILTCTGNLSRNRRVGMQLAAGATLAEALAALGHVAEGVSTAPMVLARTANNEFAFAGVQTAGAIGGVLGDAQRQGAAVARGLVGKLVDHAFGQALPTCNF